MADHPAIALIEFSSIARGTRAADALAKKAVIEILRAGTLHPGKYAILIAGQVGAVEESYVEGLRIGADSVIDRVLLSDAAARLYDALLGREGDWAGDTLGIIETTTLASTLEAADAAVKGAHVELVQIRLGDGLHGKGLSHWTGMQADVEAAIEIGAARVASRGQEACTAVIPRLDGDIRGLLKKSTWFAQGSAKEER